MDLKDISILILAVGISTSCVGISIQIMRLLSVITENVRDLRKTVKNVGVLTDDLVKNQRLIKEGIETILEIIQKIKNTVNLLSNKIIQPITIIFGFLTSVSESVERIKSKFGKKDK